MQQSHGHFETDMLLVFVCDSVISVVTYHKHVMCLVSFNF